MTGGDGERRGEPLPDDLGEARRALLAQIAGSRWRGDADLVLLAVQEAMTNALRHGRGIREARSEVASGMITVEVADFGEPFDAEPYLRAAPDLFVERGRGLWMMGELASGFEHRHDGAGNVLELRFGGGGVGHADPGPGSSAVAAMADAARPLFEAIDAGVILVDDRLVVRVANAAVLRMMGCKADETIGHDVRSFATAAKANFREPDDFLDRVLYLHAHPQELADDLLVAHTGVMLRRRSFPVHGDDGAVLGRLDAYSQIGEESSVIASMQRALLPPLPDWSDLDVGAIYHPATSSAFVGGDFYDFLELPGGHRCVVIGDVSGRGAAAAAASATVRAYLRALLGGGGITAAFADLDRAVSRELADEEFVTMAVVMEEASGLWTALSCGHEPLLLLRGGEVEVLDVPGVLLGMDLGGTRVRRTFTMAPGDVLLLYTDGVVDAGHGVHRFGLDRLRQALVDSAGGNALEVVTRIDQRVHDFAGGRIPDDHALVAVVFR